jgi:thiol:disulfide interchange protein DsbC
MPFMPKQLILVLFATFAITVFVPATLAQTGKNSSEEKVKQAAEKILRAQIDSVRKTSYLGLYELYIDGQIYYTDEKVSVLLAGRLFDTRTMTNVTEARLGQLSAIKFSDLPTAQAIKQVRGDGKRVLATFEDPNCGYCKRLAQELVKLDNVTLYTFLYPLLSEDSDKKARQIWCATDKAKAWNDWMVDNKAPDGAGNCDTSAIDRNIDLARKLNIRGTPALFFADGSRIPGAISLAEIEQKMKNIGK